MRRFWLRTSTNGVKVRLDMERLDREIRGQRIRHVREHRRQMSRRQLAQLVPGPKGTTTEKQIERVESGEWDTDDSMIDAIAEALDVPRPSSMNVSAHEPGTEVGRQGMLERALEAVGDLAPRAHQGGLIHA